MGTRQLLQGTVFVDDPPPPGPGSSGTITPLIANAEYADDIAFSGSTGIAGNPYTEGDAADTLVETSVTTNGVEYLVMYRGNGGITADADTGQIQMRALLGSTELGYSIDERFTSLSGATPRTWRNTTLSGFAVVTGDGTTLSIEGKHIDNGGSSTSNFGSCFISGIPLTLLNEGHDYFKSVVQDDETTTSPPDSQLGTTINASDGTTSPPNPVEDADSVYTFPITVPDTGDYLVLMSLELAPTNVFNTNGIYVYPVIDNTVLQQGHAKHCSSNGGHTDDPQRWNIQNWSHSEVVNLSAGRHDIEIRALGMRGNNKISTVRRPRIIVLRGASFTALKQTKLTTQTGGWNTSDTLNTVVSHTTDAAGATEDIITLGNAIGRGGDNGLGSAGTSGGVLYNFFNNTDNINWNFHSGIMQGVINPSQGAAGYPQQQFMGHVAVTIGQTKVWVIQHRQLQVGAHGGVKTGFSTWIRADPDWVTYAPPGDTDGMPDGERDTRIISLHLRTTGT